MPNAFFRKSIFLWTPASVYGGSLPKITAALTGAGFESVMLHVENLGLFRSRFSRSFVDTLRSAGLAVIGSSAIYGAVPKQEGEAAGQLAREYSLDGFVFDAEGKFEKMPKSNSNAVKVLQAYKGIAAAPAAWCSWALFFSLRGLQWHPVDVMRAAMEFCDVGMPMAYWNWGDDPKNATAYLERSLSQWRKWTDKPIIPAGRAYIGDGGRARPDAVTAFDRAVRESGCKGITWWSMQHAVNATALPGVWDALAGMPAYGLTAPQPVEHKAYLPGVMGWFK